MRKIAMVDGACPASGRRVACVILAAVAGMLVATPWNGDARAEAPMVPAQSGPLQPDPVQMDRNERRPTHAEEKDEHLRIGALAGVGFPRPLSIEALIKVERAFALGVEYSVLPTTSISGVDTRLWAIAADARFFPFHGPFFLGVRAGRQHLDASGTITVAGLGTATGEGTIDTFFVSPRAGALWTWDSGISLGFDMGLQIPLRSTFASNLPTGVPVSVEEDVRRVADTLGSTVLPTFDLLRVGFLF